MGNLLLSAVLLFSACQDTTPAESSDTEEEEDTQAPWTGPEYDGTCPQFESGLNSGFFTGDQEREMRIRLPEDPQGAALLFAWHWLGGSASDAMSYLNLKELANTEQVIIVVPESDGHQGEWHTDAWPSGNPDLALFDDVIACMHEQFDIDQERIYSTGFSAGGMWTTYLIIYRSELLAAAAPMSGGFLSAWYRTPDVNLPVILTWGGASDVYEGFSFDESNNDFSSDLRNDGHFVVECEHPGGHTVPSGSTDYNWQFFKDHPRNMSAESYKGSDGLPAVFPSWCQIPETTEQG